MQSKKEIYIIAQKRKVAIPKRLWDMLAIYKVFFPPETTVQIGKTRVIKINEIEVWPPPEQVSLLEVEQDKIETKLSMG